MPTKCVIMESGTSKTLEPVKFVKSLKEDSFFRDTESKPYDYEVITLIVKDYNEYHHDIMFAFNEGHRELGILFLGFWNDGFVDHK